VDDGCTDGTADAVREVWPEATIIQGDGNLFWCGGMRVAWTAAAKTDPDYYLLLNDDTTITADAVAELLALAPSPRDEVIAVAPIADPETGEVVCGGHLGHAPRPVVPKGVPFLCHTMNANCTLVPRSVFRKIGMFHHSYTHAMGDFDYGFLASRNGVRVIQAGKVVGTSKTNPTLRTWRDRSLPRRERLRLLWKHPKGLPFFEWATYTRRNMGPIWPYRAISPALRILAGR
jgi:GT2 family glycosyltransferase